jgi:hypothetical protein
LELSAQGIDWRYHKIQAQPEQIEALLIRRGVKAIPRQSAQIVLDFDATDDPLHGSQEGPTLTATIASTATCHYTAFAVIFRCLPS